jgi:hypothetical protein
MPPPGSSIAETEKVYPVGHWQDLDLVMQEYWGEPVAFTCCAAPTAVEYS